MIMKNLHSRIGRPLIANKIERLEFIKYLDAAKKKLSGKRPVADFRKPTLHPFFFPSFHGFCLHALNV